LKNNNSILERKNIHFVGIGGIGMSGIARILLEMGYHVSGSDLKPNNLTESLRSMGAKIFEGHKASNIPANADLVVYSSSIPEDNAEFRAARRRKIRMAHRAEVLASLFNEKDGIAVTGMHGKTTTTSLISVILESAGADPTVVVGGEVDKFHGNARLGKGDYFVAEADESDSSFLHFKPSCAVITNIEREHLDHYHSIGEIKKSFTSFVGNVKKGGIVIYNADDPIAKEVMKNFTGKSATFGLSRGADIYAAGVKMDGFRTSFKCFYKNRPLGQVELSIPGRHNVLNALAAILAGLISGLKFSGMRSALKDFGGAKRRFQLRCQAGGVMIVDDYAHHPTEIKAVLNACRNWRNKRLIAVFQPHRYTRTKFLADDFGKCFDLADKLILTDIYAANEKPIKNISARTIYDKVIASGLRDVEVIKKEEIPERVMGLVKDGDMIVVMGAGDIKNVADEISARLEASSLKLMEYADELKGLVKGKIKLKEGLARHTSFRIGGPSDVWAEPADASDLKNILLFARERRIPVFIIGNGSNVLADDNGFRGIVINLASPFFKKLECRGGGVSVGAGYSLAKLVRFACEKGLGGLESLIGIPGTVGGAIYMNAGGYANPIYRNMGGLVESLKVMDYGGNTKNLTKGEINFGYRFSNLGPYVILAATLKLEKSDRETLLSSCSQYLKMKRDKQVLDMPSAGCVFKNPPDFQFTCGQMIEMLGLKGRRVGGAEISAKHANFIINRGGATCKDVLQTIDMIKKKVRENYDVSLNLEIKII